MLGFRYRRYGISGQPCCSCAGGAGSRIAVAGAGYERSAQVSDLNADRVVGDLRDAGSIEKAMAGCDVVFHVAADYRLWVRDPEEMYRSNVEGTRTLLEAARKHGVRRVVYTSSVATMGFTLTTHLRRAAVPTRAIGG